METYLIFPFNLMQTMLDLKIKKLSIILVEILSWLSNSPTKSYSEFKNLTLCGEVSAELDPLVLEIISTIKSYSEDQIDRILTVFTIGSVISKEDLSPSDKSNTVILKNILELSIV